MEAGKSVVVFIMFQGNYFHSKDHHRDIVAISDRTTNASLAILKIDAVCQPEAMN